MYEAIYKLSWQGRSHSHSRYDMLYMILVLYLYLLCRSVDLKGSHSPGNLKGFVESLKTVTRFHKPQFKQSYILKSVYIYLCMSMAVIADSYYRLWITASMALRSGITCSMIKSSLRFRIPHSQATSCHVVLSHLMTLHFHICARLKSDLPRHSTRPRSFAKESRKSIIPPPNTSQYFTTTSPSSPLS